MDVQHATSGKADPVPEAARTSGRSMTDLVSRSLSSPAGVSTSYGEKVEILTPGDSALLTLRAAMRALLYRAAEDRTDLSVALNEALTVVGESPTRRGRRSNYETSGSFQSERWELSSEGSLHQIFLSGERLGDDAEEVAHTLVHELAHLFAYVRGQRDCSDRGRYHNKAFRENAEALGLVVERSHHYGYRTTGISESLRLRLDREIRELNAALVIRIKQNSGWSAIPGSGSDITSAEPRKYVTAACSCNPRRVIRVAVGHWQPDSIGCFVCRRFFVDLGPPTLFNPSPRSQGTTNLRRSSLLPPGAARQT